MNLLSSGLCRPKYLFAALLPLAILCLAPAARAAEPPSTPILRIEAGMHSAGIKRIGTDAQGRWLVTAGDDKLARVWDIASGRLLNILRPPIGTNNEGKLFSMALSPDGSTVAVGGWTQFNDGKRPLAGDGHNIFLLDRATGRVLHRIGNLPAVIIDLTFSPDGRYLGAALSNKDGVRVWRTDNWTMIGQGGHDDQSYGLDFSRDGRLAASSYDGNVRLYSVGSDGLRLLAKNAPPGGKRPYAVRFSPDGSRIAVGFSETTAVNVLDGRTLAFLYAPDSTGMGNGNISKVAWSSDGQVLFAGGQYEKNGWRVIRRWEMAGRGASRDEPAARTTVMDQRSLPDGGVVYGAGDPAWGVLDAQGRRTRRVSGPIADFRTINDAFQLSADGSQVRFGFEYPGKITARFDLRRGMKMETGGEPPLSPPRRVAPGLNFQGHIGTMTPTLDGEALKLDSYETSRSLAIQADGQSFLLGADFGLRLFGRDGKMRWRNETPEAVWGVNITADGRTAVAAIGDGTIRWYDIADGSEKLAFFPHADRTRWVAWTPSGYYAASPGGDELIGWHLNNGKDAAADFFPAARFRNRFFRPDVVAHALEANTEAEALRLADAESGRRSDQQPVAIQNVLPPVIEILGPQDGSRVSATTVSVQYATRSAADAPVTGLRARVNGQSVSLDTRNLVVQSGQGTRSVTIPIPAEDAEIQLFAENKHGVSTPASLRVTWAGQRQAQEVSFKPKLYVLAVGVSKYANPEYNLGLAAKDARDIATVLQAQKGKLYADVQVKILTDGNATRDDVMDGLDWLKTQVTARDVGVMFLAGHGVNDNTGRYYFMPHNANPEKLLRTGVPQSDIRDTLNSLPGKAIFFVDTCHSGNALGTAKTRSMVAVTDAFVNELASAENGVVVFTAATGKQLSQEDKKWGNGAFTKAVVEGLSGKADFQKSGRITHKALDLYVSERVKELTRGTQSPVSITPAGVSDFPLAVVGK